ncbi:MAG: bacterioferritin [Planctomycetales bacterium]|nr:bacterioferritin [Planctomycetales bacterium]
MKNTKTLENLQTGLAMELTAAHQYQLHAAVLADWGMDLLAGKMAEEMTEELGHSDAFLNRIMFLKGTPNMVLQKSPVLATTLHEMFATDAADEREAINFYTAAAATATVEGDVGSRTIFERILLNEEEHLAWLELQLDLLKKLGEPVYIAKHLSSLSPASGVEA